MKGRISLEGLSFHAYHGVYAHEKEQGNTFEADLVIEHETLPEQLHDDLQRTVDYEELYKLVKKGMEVRVDLLETVAFTIMDSILKQMPAVQWVQIKISKLNPPIGGECRKASVTFEKYRS